MQFPQLSLINKLWTEQILFKKWIMKLVCCQDVGYNHGKTFFAGMMKGGAYPPYLRSPDILTAKIESRKPLTTQATSYTFTDLAQMVCKVQRRPYLIGKSLLEFYHNVNFLMDHKSRCCFNHYKSVMEFFIWTIFSKKLESKYLKLKIGV